MTPNPFYNAIFALAYIVGIVSIMWFGSTVFWDQQEDTIFMPMTMLALLVLSVTVMAYLFFYQPIVLLLEGKRERAVKLFLQTVGTFALLTALVLLLASVVPSLA